MQFTKQETATVLAALRYVQEGMSNNEQEFTEVMPMHFEECPSLTLEEIDSLCERINFDEAPIVLSIRKGIVEREDGGEQQVLLHDYDIEGADCGDLIATPNGQLYHEYQL